MAYLIDTNILIAAKNLYYGMDFHALRSGSQWVNNHQAYSTSAKQVFLDCSDYFVVSQALAGGHTVVTHEKPEKSVARIKIPNICTALGISYVSPWTMLRAEQASFVLNTTIGQGATI